MHQNTLFCFSPKSGDASPQFERVPKMTDEIIKYEEADELYLKIVNLIKSRKTAISQALNAAMIFLYWEIGETICC